MSRSESEKRRRAFGFARRVRGEHGDGPILCDSGCGRMAMVWLINMKALPGDPQRLSRWCKEHAPKEE